MKIKIKKTFAKSNAVLSQQWTRVIVHIVDSQGRCPFNQKFRKFRNETKWYGLVHLVLSRETFQKIQK